jgi:hypothetical protein
LGRPARELRVVRGIMPMPATPSWSATRSAASGGVDPLGKSTDFPTLNPSNT